MPTSNTYKLSSLQSAFPEFKKYITPSKMWNLGVDSFVATISGRNCTFYYRDNDSIIEQYFHKDKERLQTIYVDDQKNIFVFSKFSIYHYVNPNRLKQIIPLTHNGSPLAVATINQHPETKHLWIGTEGQGLFILKGNKLINVLEKKYVNKILFRHQQFIFSNDDGIFVYRNRENDYSLELAYSARDGIYTNELLDIRIKNDSLLAISKSDMILFELISKKQITDSLELYTFKADNIDYLNSSNKVIPYNYKQLLIEFSLFNYDYVDEIGYYYYLNDSLNWISLKENAFNLQGLSSGNYQLTIKAVDKVTGLELTRSTFPFEVQTPWWRTNLFLLLVNILIWTGIFYFYRNRFRKKTARENKIIELEFSMKELKLKALEAQMNPHFIYNSLSSIQYYIQANMKEEAEQYLTSFSKLVRSYLEATRKHMISLEEEIELLNRYISLEKLRYEDKFNYEIKCDPQLDKQKVFINTMLLQPFVENAIQHGLFHRPQGGLIAVEFIKQANNLLVLITDNGIGFSKSLELKKTNSKVISSRAMEIFYEKLQIINKLHPGSINFTHQNLDDNNNEFKGTVVKIIFQNVCN